KRQNAKPQYMIDLRLISSIVILAISSYIVLVNWYRFINGYRRFELGLDDEKSGIPFSFPLAFIAYFIYPGGAKAWIFIIPAVDVINFAIVYALYGIACRGMTGRDPVEMALLSDDVSYRHRHSPTTNF